MDKAERRKLAEKANLCGRECRYIGAPILSHDSSQDTLCAWLQWCDPNGCHTQELFELDCCDTSPCPDECDEGMVGELGRRTPCETCSGKGHIVHGGPEESHGGLEGSWDSLAEMLED